MRYWEIQELLCFATGMNSEQADEFCNDDGDYDQLVYDKFEVGFDEFTGNEMAWAEKMYSHLNLGGFDKAKPRIQHYLDSVKTYKKNKFRKIDPEMEARIRKEWAFAFKEWGYE